jgi:uncharacterized protein YyaL (SSP411 family)
MSNRTDIFLQEAKETLDNGILKFLISLRPEKSTEAMEHNKLLWSYAAAYGYSKDKKYLLAASKERDYYVENFIDHKFGGVFWSVNEKGERLDDSARLRAQGGAIYAFSEMYRTTKDEESLKNAINIYKIVEKEFKDDNGQYAEALSRDFKPLNEDKNPKSLISLMQGYAALYRICPEEHLRNALIHIIKNLPLEEMQGRDAAEACWTMCYCADAVKDADLVNEVRSLAYTLWKTKVSTLKNIDIPTKVEEVIVNICLWRYFNEADAIVKAMDIWNTDLKKNESFLHEMTMHNVRMCRVILRMFE